MSLAHFPLPSTACLGAPSSSGVLPVPVVLPRTKANIRCGYCACADVGRTWPPLASRDCGPEGLF